tara:strand:+ start:360 stop:473 length:114 start_codon:yes stop_codon:yes gene_type:complete
MIFNLIDFFVKVINFQFLKKILQFYILIKIITLKLSF